MWDTEAGKKGFHWIEKFLNFRERERERIRKLSDLKGKEIEICRNAGIRFFDVGDFAISRT